MKRIILLCATAMTLFFAASWASPKPNIHNNFSGTWQMDANRSESAHFGQPFVPVIFVIRQTPTQVRIETRRDGQSETLIYNMDGSASEQAAQANGPVSWSARWDGDKLVTETTRNINGSAVIITESRSLDGKGKEMIVYRTLAVQHGYESGKTSSTAKDVFIKAL